MSDVVFPGKSSPKGSQAPEKNPVLDPLFLNFIAAAIVTAIFAFFVLKLALYGAVQGKIAYIRMRSGTYSYLYVTNAFGFPKRRLSNETDWDVSPAWSPDNRQIAYECRRREPETRGICTINVDGTNRKQVTFTEGQRHMRPVWSPSGQEIAFESGSDIFVVRLEDLTVRQVTQAPSLDFHPVWSPDGRKLAFVSERDGNLEIYLANPDGSEQVNLTRNEADDYHPVWTKNGSAILFVSDRLGNDEIFKLSLATGRVENLTNHPDDDNDPTISSDGQRVAFVREHDIYVMNIDGTGQERLTSFKGYDGTPTWSPDGKAIAFLSARFGSWDVFIMRADGRWELPVHTKDSSSDVVFSNP